MSNISLSKNAAFNYIGQFYTTFISIVMFPIYIKYLGSESFGLYSFYTMLVAWMLLLDMGLSQAMSRETARLNTSISGNLQIKKILRSVECFFGLFAFIIFYLVLFFSDWLATHWLNFSEIDTQVVIASIKLMGVMLALRLFVSGYTQVIVGFEHQVWLNIYRIFFASLKFIGGLFVILFINNSILSFFKFQLIVSVMELLVLAIKVYSLLPKTKLILPSLSTIKPLAPFALSVAYTASIWIIYTQIDKLLLSHFIPLDKYAYFAFVSIISTAIMQFSGPLGQAVIPRMVQLTEQKKLTEMISVYRHATRFVSIVVAAVLVVTCSFTYELLYAWTGYHQAAQWASPILFWYVLGSGLMSLAAFPYFLQFVHGNLKYHVRFNTFFPIIVLPIVYYSIIHYGALGAGKAWFVVQFFSLLLWPMFIHHIFLPGVHKKWFFYDVLPPLLLSTIAIVILHWMNIDLLILSRLGVLIILVALGAIFLILNTIIYREYRHKLMRILTMKSV